MGGSWAVITAAGAGTRLGSGGPKALVEAAGSTLLSLAFERVLAVPDLRAVVVTCPAGMVADFVAALGAGPQGQFPSGEGHPQVLVVEGGPSRQSSVSRGLDALAGVGMRSDGKVLVHDAARALAPTALMVSLLGRVDEGADAVIPGLPVTDTIKQVSPAGSASVGEGEFVVDTLARETLRVVQTPQAFRVGVLAQAHAEYRQLADSEVTAATDDAGLVEMLGYPVQVIVGDPLAFKVTTPEDLSRLQTLLR